MIGAVDGVVVFGWTLLSCLAVGCLYGIWKQLVRMNQGRDEFNLVMADFFAKLTAKDDDVSLRSGQPAAAPDGQEGGQHE